MAPVGLAGVAAAAAVGGQQQHQKRNAAVGVEGDSENGKKSNKSASSLKNNTVKKKQKKRDGSTLKKAPQAPKRFKSSWILFYTEKRKEVKNELGDKATVTEISRRTSEMWKTLPPEQRAYWDDVAAKDKKRFMEESALYTGPWKVPHKRAKKDPTAPKRSMSAFLFFSQGKRQELKRNNPEMDNLQVSRMLGEMWRSLTEEERKPWLEKEMEEREKYKVAIADWRKDFEIRQESQKKAQEEQVLYMTKTRGGEGGPPMNNNNNGNQYPQGMSYNDPNMMMPPPQQHPEEPK